MFGKPLLYIALFSQILLGQTSSAPQTMAQGQTSPANSGSINISQLIDIDKSIEMVDKPYVQMPSQVWGSAIGGAAGAAFASGAGSDEDKFKAFMLLNKIDLKSIVFNCFKNRLSQPNLRVKLTEIENDYVLHLAITQWGIHGSGAFTLSKLVPLLCVRAQFTKKDGTLIWKTEECLRFPSKKELPSHVMEEFIKDPKLLSDGFAAECNIIVNTICNKFD